MQAAREAGGGQDLHVCLAIEGVRLFRQNLTLVLAGDPARDPWAAMQCITPGSPLYSHSLANVEIELGCGNMDDNFLRLKASDGGRDTKTR